MPDLQRTARPHHETPPARSSSPDAQSAASQESRCSRYWSLSSSNDRPHTRRLTPPDLGRSADRETHAGRSAQPTRPQPFRRAAPHGGCDRPDRRGSLVNDVVPASAPHFQQPPPINRLQALGVHCRDAIGGHLVQPLVAQDQRSANSPDLVVARCTSHRAATETPEFVGGAHPSVAARCPLPGEGISVRRSPGQPGGRG